MERIATEPVDQDLSLYSQNIYGLPFGKDLKARVTAFVARLDSQAQDDFQPDVIGVQEGFTKYTRRALQSHKAHPYFSAPRVRSGRILTSGLITLSRYPIVYTEFRRFHDSANTDRFANKGVLLTRIQHPLFGEVDVYNLHSQASYKSPQQYVDCREAQRRELIEFIREASTDGQGNYQRAVFVKGDFNFREEEGNYRALTEAEGFVDLLRAYQPQSDRSSRRADNPYVDDREGNARLDYIFFHPGGGWDWDQSGSQAWIVDSCTAQDHTQDCRQHAAVSDHEGVFAKIRLIRTEDVNRQSE